MQTAIHYFKFIQFFLGSNFLILMYIFSWSSLQVRNLTDALQINTLIQEGVDPTAQLHTTNSHEGYAKKRYGKFEQEKRVGKLIGKWLEVGVFSAQESSAATFLSAMKLVVQTTARGNQSRSGQSQTNPTRCASYSVICCASHTRALPLHITSADVVNSPDKSGQADQTLHWLHSWARQKSLLFGWAGHSNATHSPKVCSFTLSPVSLQIVIHLIDAFITQLNKLVRILGHYVGVLKSQFSEGLGSSLRINLTGLSNWCKPKN